MTEAEFHAIMLDMSAKFRRLADEIDFEYHVWLAQQEQLDFDSNKWLTTDQPEHFNCRCSVEPRHEHEYCYLSRDERQRFEEVKEYFERPGGYM